MSKARDLGKEIEKRIEKEFGDYYESVNEFWETDGKRIYSALHELVSYAMKLEREKENGLE